MSTPEWGMAGGFWRRARMVQGRLLLSEAGAAGSELPRSPCSSASVTTKAHSGWPQGQQAVPGECHQRSWLAGLGMGFLKP